jgi:hypothetical protein
VWCSITLLATAALAPLQADQLAVTNVRPTYGVLGAPRSDTKYLPGDEFVLSFDIQGAKVNPAGKILYSVGMEVTDPKGQVQFKQLPNDLEAEARSGSTTLPACASVQIGLDQEPGTYTVKVSVTDRVAGVTREIARTCEILPRAFGLVRVRITSDSEGRNPVGSLRLGQTVWINFAAVRFGSNPSSKQPQVSVVMRVLDAAGRPILGKPSRGEITKDVPANVRALPMQFALAVNRTGKFTVELTATDHIAGKTCNVSFPITVAKAK